MPETRDTICITCGQTLGDVPRLHRLADGSPCPSCRDRLLETLPPLLPRSGPVAAFESDDFDDSSEPEFDESPEFEVRDSFRDGSDGGRASGAD